MAPARVLIAEDEPGIALALEDDLRREGYDVTVVGDGERAARAALDATFDLLVLDVMLPKKDGFDVCRDLRRAGIDTPILLLTARTLEAEKLLGFETGADDYVTKPYSARELRARIKALVRRGRRADLPAVYRFGDGAIDFARCELTRNGRAVDLSALEYRLLTAFVRHEGRVLTRTQLLDEVWGRDTHVTDRVVDNQVTNLRKKIEPEPERPRYLVSLRGLGYRFDGDRQTDA